MADERRTGQGGEAFGEIGWGTALVLGHRRALRRLGVDVRTLAVGSDLDAAAVEVAEAEGGAVVACAAAWT